MCCNLKKPPLLHYLHLTANVLMNALPAKTKYLPLLIFEAPALSWKEVLTKG